MQPPVFGFLAVTSGSHEGAIIHHARLANALHRRGFKVVIYWVMERNPDLVAPGIFQRVLMRSLRYYARAPSGLCEALSRVLDLVPLRDRRRFVQRHPSLAVKVMRNFVFNMCGDDPDPRLVDRLERAMADDGISHLLPTFAMSCPLAAAVKARGRHGFDFLATFQGEEIFAYHANAIGRLDAYYRQLRRCIEASPWKAVALSDDYARRLQEEVGLEPDRMATIPPGVELPPPQQPRPAFDIVAAGMPWLQRDVPIVTYLGRQDSEKGIDLLLYASRMLRERAVAHQLVICGGSSFGSSYRDVCMQIAHHLGVPVSWKHHVSDEMRAALYAHSRCIVYPPIHREPFGMVAPEAMAYGTPVLVPNHGGIAETVHADGAVGGLTFRAWDTRDLATQLEKLLTDDALHAALAAAAPTVAAHFSIDATADRVLAHMGLPQRPAEAERRQGR